MKLVGLLFVCLGFASCAAGQVQSDFESQFTTLGKDPTYREWPLVGTFHFKSVPHPLDTAIVDFSIEEVNSLWDSTNSTWHMLVDYTKGATLLVSDSVYLWTGQHKRGDKFSGTMKFVPLVSGRQSILLYMAPPAIWDDMVKGMGQFPTAKTSGVSFEWCLDDEGQLTFLGSTGGDILESIPCNGIGSSFARAGHARLLSNPSETSLHPVDYWVELPELPVIGDTTRIVFHLKAQRQLPQGLDLVFASRCVDVIRGPAPVAGPLNKGDSINLEISVCPRAVRDYYDVMVHIVDPAASEQNVMREQSIAVGFVFSNDGHLRYVGDGRWTVPARLLPTNYPNSNAERDYGELKVKSTDK